MRLLLKPGVRPLKAIGLASFAALAIQPLVFLLWFYLPILFSHEPFSLREAAEISLWAVLVAAAHLVVIGLPLFYMLWRYSRLGWPAICLAGFFTGSIGIAILGWPLRTDRGNYSSSGLWHGQTRDFVVNGVPTVFGWLQYAEGLIYFGLHGVAGASAFYLVWRRLRLDSSFGSKPLPGSA